MIYVENNSLNPYFNFALEYYLMNEKDLGDDIIFMFWRTNPTLMVGKFQNTIEEINQKYVEDNQINVVRRITGGGTIYTDLNGWQFTFITKNSRSSEIDFATFTKPIIDALKSQNIEARFNSRNDLLINGKKFSGNAQCIKDGCRLHHGSILFDTNIEAMVKSITVAEEKIISKGIKSIKERVTNVSSHLDKKMDALEFKELMLDSLLKESQGVYKLNEEDIKRVNEIKKEKFETWEWNYGASPKFNITKWKRYDGGKVEFKIDVNKGIIQNCVINGDFFGEGEVSDITSSLLGCKYNKEDIKNILSKIDIDKYFYKINKDEILECII
ncbi:MAG: lipoate--protein ligase [Terrisporobacter sp.]|uniref:lipoate--protein ligase n=1 Tax=Terrisporobacter sp. TaxID=1965305 RepID=UPI002FC63494